MIARPLSEADRAWAAAELRATWASTLVARTGELIDAAGLPGLVLAEGDRPAGLLTYTVRAAELEVVTLHVQRPGHGGGWVLMDAVCGVADAHGVDRIWLVTTNDNTRALRFYQRWGMDLAALNVGGVDCSRRLKPTIPALGQDGIPIRHELQLERRRPWPASARLAEAQVEDSDPAARRRPPDEGNG